MPLYFVKALINMTPEPAVLVNREGGHGSDLRVEAAPGELAWCNTHIPWCSSQADFDSGRSLQLTYGPDMIHIWQEHFDGPGGEDKVRFDPNGYRRPARGIGRDFAGNEYLVDTGSGLNYLVVDLRRWVICYPLLRLDRLELPVDDGPFTFTPLPGGWIRP
jgi:hypothetical protein